MFDRIGMKIKVLATIICFVGIVASVVGAMILLSEFEVIAIVLLFAGPFVSWILSWFLYGFGEIIEKLHQIEENTRKSTVPTEHVTSPRADKKKPPEQPTPPAPVQEEDSEPVEVDYQTIKCPRCKEKLWVIDENSSFECPHCGHLIKNGH